MGTGEQVRRLQVGGGLAALVLVLAACGGGGSEQDSEPGPVAAPTPALAVTFSPGPDSADVAPDTPLTVTATAGKLTDVRVEDADGGRIEGDVSGDGSSWEATGQLLLAQHYTVTASGLDARGAVVEQKSVFDTLDVPEKERLYAKVVAPHEGEVVGVAHPLVVGFNHPVRDKQAVQDALHVEAVSKTGEEVEGAWYWIDDQYVHFRPRAFWPANTTVKLNVDIAGVKGGEDLWGGGNREVSYKIGRRQVIKVDARKHILKVVNSSGKVVRSYPVSTGKSGWETRNGTKVLMEKILDKKWTNEAIDAPEHYRLESSYAMRMTNSGEFIHDAPWNTGNIGSANTSHGCVGMRVSDMAWVYKHSIVGDPIIVEHSPRSFPSLLNRYADWNVPWAEWSEGNAEAEYL